MPGVGACLEISFRGSIRRSSIDPLCQAVGVFLRCGSVELVVCDVERVSEISAVTVEGLARLQLAARRAGCGMRLRRATGDLTALISFMGLTGVLQISGGEPVGETEEREKPPGVEEEADPGDPVP
jgi:hypothetical protein